MIIPIFDDFRRYEPGLSVPRKVEGAKADAERKVKGGKGQSCLLVPGIRCTFGSFRAVSGCSLPRVTCLPRLLIYEGGERSVFGQRCAASGKLRGLEGSRIFVEFLVEGWGARERERERGGRGSVGDGIFERQRDSRAYPCVRETFETSTRQLDGDTRCAAL